MTIISNENKLKSSMNCRYKSLFNLERLVWTYLTLHNACYGVFLSCYVNVMVVAWILNIECLHGIRLTSLKIQNNLIFSKVNKFWTYFLSINPGPFLHLQLKSLKETSSWHFSFFLQIFSYVSQVMWSRKFRPYWNQD